MFFFTIFLCIYFKILIAMTTMNDALFEPYDYISEPYNDAYNYISLNLDQFYKMFYDYNTQTGIVLYKQIKNIINSTAISLNVLYKNFQDSRQFQFESFYAYYNMFSRFISHIILFILILLIIPVSIHKQIIKMTFTVIFILLYLHNFCDYSLNEYEAIIMILMVFILYLCKYLYGNLKKKKDYSIEARVLITHNYYNITY